MPARIELELYADEIKEIKCSDTGERWTYIGLLAVPVAKKTVLLEKLHKYRTVFNCYSELHGNGLKSRDKLGLAKAWLKDVLLRDYQEQSLYFSILGINQSNINTGAFGEKEFDNMYNRLFRSTIVGLLHRSFDKNALKVVNKIYHDKANIQSHEYFSWHVPYHIDKNYPDISIECREITFIDSDHRKSESDESHLIQLIDLILSGTSQCLDFTSQHVHKIELGRTMYPLVRRMIQEPFNLRSNFGHSGKYMVSFFPRKQLSLSELNDDLTRSTSGYYQSRRILFDERGHGQENMFG